MTSAAPPPNDQSDVVTPYRDVNDAENLQGMVMYNLTVNDRMNPSIFGSYLNDWSCCTLAVIEIMYIHL
jgi:hypothetical protein